MRRFFEAAALPTCKRFCPLKVSAVILLLLVLVLSSWRPAVALGSAMTCGDPQEPGLEHLSQCNDPEGVIISVSDARATEGTDETIDFEVSFNKPHRSRSVAMDWSISGSTAVAGEDYTDASGTLTFASSETTKTISISLLDDSASEGVEPFTLSLADASGANFVEFGKSQQVALATGTILPDEDADAPTVTVTTEIGVTPPVSGFFHALVRFSKPVNGFQMSDLRVTNGSPASNQNTYMFHQHGTPGQAERRAPSRCRCGG